MTTSSGTPGAFPPPPEAQPFPSHQGSAPVPAGTNTMAILAIVFAFVFSPLGIFFGVRGRKQTAQTGQDGRKLATIGMWLSVAFLALGILFVVIRAVSGSDGVSQSAVEERVSAEVTNANGTAPESVSCPSGLDAKAGATVTCQVKDSTETYNVVVDVQSVDGNTINYDMNRQP